MKIVKYKTAFESLGITVISGAIIEVIKLIISKNYYPIWLIYFIPVVVFVISYTLISNFKSNNVETKISIFITNNKETYKRSDKNVFKNIENEKEWMFLKLSAKYPQLTSASIRKHINNHYNLIDS